MFFLKFNLLKNIYIICLLSSIVFIISYFLEYFLPSPMFLSKPVCASSNLISTKALIRFTMSCCTPSDDSCNDVSTDFQMVPLIVIRSCNPAESENNWSKCAKGYLGD